jgi:hypothetical protein
MDGQGLAFSPFEFLLQKGRHQYRRRRGRGRSTTEDTEEEKNMEGENQKLLIRKRV